MRPGVNGTVTVWPGILRRLLDARAAGQHDQIGERDLLAAGLSRVELPLDALQRLQHLRQLGRLIDCPILLRRETDARTVRAAALVGAAEGRRRRPRRGYELRDAAVPRPGSCLERGDVLRIDQLVIHCGNRVLPASSSSCGTSGPR